MDLTLTETGCRTCWKAVGTIDKGRIEGLEGIGNGSHVGCEQAARCASTRKQGPRILQASGTVAEHKREKH